MYLVRVLIGSLDCLCNSWLVRVISLVLVFNTKLKATPPIRISNLLLPLVSSILRESNNRSEVNTFEKARTWLLTSCSYCWWQNDKECYLVIEDIVGTFPRVKLRLNVVGRKMAGNFVRATYTLLLVLRLLLVGRKENASLLIGWNTLRHWHSRA